MKTFRWLIILIIIGLGVSLTACDNPIDRLFGKKDTDVSLLINKEVLKEQEDGIRETVIYYRDEKGTLVPVMKKIPWEEGIAKAALKLLVDDPIVRDDLAQIGLRPVLPPGTEVMGMSINDGLCKVEFSNNFLSYKTKEDENAIVKSVVYTLTEFDSIDQVQIMVEGQDKNKLSFGTQINKPLKRENINLTYDLKEEEIPVVVYYKTTTNGEDSFFIPVTKGVSALKVDIKSSLNALLEGAPEDTGFYSELPAGVTLNDVYVKDGVAYIDFSEEIKNMPDNKEHQQSMVYELGLTLKEIEPTISQVRILSGGKEIQLNPDVSLNLPNYSNH